jgi:quercetin dioxygenase-like cupin family protein
MSRQPSRREFFERVAGTGAVLSAGSLGILTACTESPGGGEQTAIATDSMRSAGTVEAARWQGAVVQHDGGQLVISGRRRAPMRIKVDSRVAAGAAMSMIVSEVAPGASIPVHLHRNEDELIFIHTGTGIITLGDTRTACSPGAVLYAPRDAWHGVDNTGATVLTWCAIYSPPGFEQFFIETGNAPGDHGPVPTPDSVAVIARKYGMVFRDT